MTIDPLVGQQLANFRIERLIKRGGMARVYYGWDVKLERPVAIKVIDFAYRDDPTYAERFVREARAVASWRHENIVQIYYADDQDGMYYFCMEYVDGMDLSEVLAQYRQAGELMPHEDVLRVGRAVASALDYAHGQGIIHRDVKPSNVMVSRDERVVLTDFGLVLDVHRGTVGHVFGSTHYIAPEQAQSSANAVPQSDIYSLGVILYQALTGVVPFDDPSPTSVALQHCTDPPPHPRDVNPSLSPETEAVLLRALSKQPENRYPTGAELMDALGRALRVDFSVREQESVPLAPRAGGASRLDTSLLGMQLDEYRLESLLGRGGMARVYCGLDVNLDRRVAIKVIDTPFRSDPDYVSRFRREAQAIARLEHPHIVRLYRYGEAEGLLYMAMQFVDGADLGKVLADYRQDGIFVEPKAASRVVREVCQALDYAHEHGVIHRDVKPSNIMLNSQGNAVLTDFGLVLLTEFGTQGQIFGSPHYVAPEQAISSANVVPQSDLYSVGVILYEMFTGELPFDAEDPLDVAMKHMSDEPIPPRDLRPEISPELEDIILRSLAKAPGARYQSGAELADALDQALGIGDAVTPPVPVGEAQSERLASAPPISRPGQQPVVAPVAVPTLEQENGPEGQPPSTARRTIEPDKLPLPPVPAAVALDAAAAALVGEATPEALPPPGPPAVVTSEKVSTPEVAEPPATISGPGLRRGLIVYLAVLLFVCVLSSLLAAGGYFLLGGTVPGLSRWVRATPSAETTAGVVLSSTTTAKASPVVQADATHTSRPSDTPPTVAATTASVTAAVTATHMMTASPTAAQTLTQTTTATATAVDTPTAMPTLTATATATAVDTPTATSTATPTHTATATATATQTPTPEMPASFELALMARGEDSLFVVNRGKTGFPLEKLRLASKKAEVEGVEWAYSVLQPDECVALWSDKQDAKAPEDLECQVVGQRLERDGPNRFWKENFGVYYDGEKLRDCKKKPKRCEVVYPDG